LSNPWLALQTGVDPVERIGEIGRAHDRFLTAGAVDERVRRVVAESWRRSAHALLKPDATAPIDLADDELDAYRAEHPLAAVLPLFREMLGDAAQDGELLAVCDARGRLLWVDGNRAAMRNAEAMNFVAGAWWDEAHAGTNAPGTALAIDHSVQIFATEHFSRPVQPWTCSAAPIHDPHTGRLLGAVDITGGDQVANPHSLALVRAAARAAEAFLAGTPRPGRQATVDALGRDEATLTIGGKRTKLGRRHSELLVLLISHPEGRTGEQLGLDLYGDAHLNPVTVRAELSRFRRTLGPDLLDSRPYRLRTVVDADFLAVTRLLEEGRVDAALDAYPGPLLPGSDAPGIARLRTDLEVQARAAVRASHDPRLLDTWTRSPWGADDLEMWQALATALTPHSPRAPLARARAVQLAREYDATWMQRLRK
jgi:hypothetical protein